MADKILDSFDVWIGTQGWKSKLRLKSIDNISLDGIARLRELIFELASKGALVKTAEKTICKTIGEIADLVMGQAPPGNECNKDGIGTVFVKTGEFGKLFPETVEWTTKPLKLAKRGDVLICVVGATVGKLNLGIDCAIGRSVAAIRPSEVITTKYLYYCLMPYTLRLRNQSRGSAQGVIGKSELNSVEIRLPIIPEQHRIVAKVDELMALCDELEQQETNHLKTHQLLVETLLGTLTQAKDAADFQTAWVTLAQHFDDLFITEDSIDQLKQTILQLAVMGKLVPQDPKDEPASVLLEKIKKEKERLVRERKLNKQNAPPVIGDEEKHFVLPKGWELARFGNVVFNRDSERDPLSVDERSTRKGEYDYYGASGVIDNIDDYLFDKPLLLIGEDGANLINRTTPIAFMARGKFWVNNHAHVLDGLNEDLLLFVCLHINAISLEEYVTGTAQPKMNQSKMNSIILRIPPFEEQKRIVAKVDELFELCDSLKERIAEAQRIKNELANTVVDMT